jgi:hypothetical protein
MNELGRPAFADQMVHHVAAVVAESRWAAQVGAASRRVVVERGAPLVYEQFSTNPLCEIERANRLETEVATGGAVRVVERRLESNRLSTRYQSFRLGCYVGPQAIKHHVADGLHLGVLDAVNTPIQSSTSRTNLADVEFLCQTRSVYRPTAVLLTCDLLRGSRG